MGAKTDGGMVRAISSADGLRIMSPDDFVARHRDWRTDGTPRPRCPVCDAEVTPHGVNTFNVRPSFHHPNGSRCPKSGKPDPRFAHLDPSEFDVGQEKRLLFELREQAAAERLYRLCNTIAGHVTGGDFEAMCRAAHNLHIWRYKGMTLDLAGFLLPTLIDMKRPRKDGSEYEFRIVVKRQRGGGFFTAPEDCELEKVFADTGRPLRAADARVKVLDPAIISKAEATWDGMSEGLKRVIRRAVWATGR
jgi:hypothetical protein